jgi:photosystem II stability/assembly factor-like uncharacterized protein
MRRRTCRVLLALVGALSSAVAAAGDGVWTTAGPPGGALRVATDPGVPGIVYTENFRSLDGGATWQPYGLNPPYGLNAVTSGTTSTVYVGGGSGDKGAVLSSADAGAHWTLASTIPNPNEVFAPSFVSISSLFGDPVSSLVVYAEIRHVLAATGFGNEVESFDRSTDGGQTWTTTTLPVGTYQGVDLAINPGNSSVLLATVSGSIFGAPEAVYRSLDSGASWTAVNSLPGPIYSVRFDPRASSVAYALGTGGFYKSTDEGVTFAAVSSSLTNGFRLVVSPTQSGWFYAISGIGVVASSDGGVTWSPLAEGLPPQGLSDLAIDRTGSHLYVASTSGVFVLNLSDTLTLNAAHPFTVTLAATDQRTGRTGTGIATQVNDLWGYFSLPAITGNADNPEVFVKMLDGTALNGAYWFFYGGLTDLEYALTVTEAATGKQRTYTKPAGGECGGSDTAAFGP